MEERRKSPRRIVHGEFVIVPTTINVQVLDLSLAGVLLQAEEQLEVGTEGSFSINLDGSRFTSEVRLQRVAPAASGSGYRLGARFVGLGPEGRQVIAQFMAQ